MWRLGAGCVSQCSSQELRLSAGFPYLVLSLSIKPVVPWCQLFGDCSCCLQSLNASVSTSKPQVQLTLHELFMLRAEEAPVQPGCRGVSWDVQPLLRGDPTCMWLSSLACISPWKRTCCMWLSRLACISPSWASCLRP
jgi:hypothetical protein